MSLTSEGTYRDGVEAALRAMRAVHYPRGESLRTSQCRLSHFHDMGDGYQETCWREASLCNGCGTEECHELPRIEALLSAIPSGWKTGAPPASGYYLGAWRRGDGWTVSELWFDPQSRSSGWWRSRGYLAEGSAFDDETVPVEAWMTMPAYEPASGPGEG